MPDIKEVEEEYDETSGELSGPVAPGQLAAMAGMSAAKLMETIRFGMAAADDDFELTEADYWKPEEPEPGQPPDELRGVYLGYVTVGKETATPRRMYTFGVESKRQAGKGHLIRMNGSAAFNAIIANFQPGVFLRIRYLGKKGTVDGYQAKMWDVATLKKK